MLPLIIVCILFLPSNNYKIIWMQIDFNADSHSSRLAKR